MSVFENIILLQIFPQQQKKEAEPIGSASFLLYLRSATLQPATLQPATLQPSLFLFFTNPLQNLINSLFYTRQNLSCLCAGIIP